MEVFTYTEYLKSQGWNLTKRMNSYDKAISEKYQIVKTKQEIEVLIIENLYVVTDKYEIWERLKPIKKETK
jgi:hypothetical protein